MVNLPMTCFVPGLNRFSQEERMDNLEGKMDQLIQQLLFVSRPR